MPKLEDHRANLVFYVVADPTSVGRHPDNAIVLPAPRISRFHAEIGTSDDGYYIQDLGSTYGTYVNGQLVQGRTELSDGDMVTMGISPTCPDGEYHFKFSDEDVPEDVAKDVLEEVEKRGNIEPGTTKYHVIDGIRVASLSGCFRGPECDELAESIKDQTTGDPRPVIIDLKDVNYMNSYAVGTFIKIEMDLREMGQEVVLAGSKGNVQRLLDMAGVFEVYRNFDSLDDALVAMQLQ